MDKLLISAAVVIITSFGFNVGFQGDELTVANDSLQVLKPKNEHSSQAFVITNLLKKYHYRKMPLDDSISSVVYQNYFASLDGSKAYFYQSDVDQFEHYRFELDNQIPTGNLNFGYEVFTLYRQRALDQIDYVFELLETPFDFTKDETYTFDREEANWPETEEERDEVWRKIIKNQALVYKLSGKDDWEEIASSLEKRYKRIQKRLYQYNSEDVFQSYMNAFTESYDPHTSYFSPPEADRFQQEMSLSLEGIGARLMQNLDYTQVVEVIPGGPAYKSKGITKDDRIIGVAQGDDGEFVDVIGWRLDEVVSKIKGPKGTVVRLQLLKASKGTNPLPDTLRLVRDKVNLEAQAVKSEMIPITENGETYNLGVISIPSFYLDFQALNRRDSDYRSTTRDVKKLITELREQGMDGLLIDLRYNGGGALQEAIDMTGLFIPNGPVVQVRNTDQSVDVMEDDDRGEVFYNGPLAVLVNRGSASASEIFSGAIQDYRRGVIIGESTFGKGTVQNVISLDRYIKNTDDKLGQVKMTLAKFYRVTGSSNQRVGISPDIQFPSMYDQNDYGEASRENALPWDKIASAPFDETYTVNEKLLDKLNQLYLEHLNSDADLQELVRDIEERKKDLDAKSVSLNFEIRKAESKDDDEDDELETEIEGDSEVAQDDGVEKKLKDDPYLKEGLRLLSAMTKFKVG